MSPLPENVTISERSSIRGLSWNPGDTSGAREAAMILSLLHRRRTLDGHLVAVDHVLELHLALDANANQAQPRTIPARAFDHHADVKTHRIGEILERVDARA